jgi:2-iminobutanoate/2-iminopropanoate deaminase
MKDISTDGAPAPGGHYSQGRVVGNLLYTAGQTGTDPATGQLAPDLAEQTRQTLRNISAILAAGGATWRDVIKVTAYLGDIGDFAAFNGAYTEIVGDAPPPRTTLGTQMYGEYLVEIECLAVLAE